MGKQAWSATEIQVRLGYVHILTHMDMEGSFLGFRLVPSGITNKKKKVSLSVILSKD